MEDTRIVLLRGINLGRAKRVAMADLRAMLEALGYEEARTLRNSGNVVLKSRPRAGGPTGGETPGAVGRRVEAALAEQLGVFSHVLVLTFDQLAAVVRENPLLDVADSPSRLQVAFLADLADRASLEPLLERDWHPEALALGARVAYMWCPDGQSPSPLVKATSDLLGDRVTTRTWSTVLKLYALAET